MKVITLVLSFLLTACSTLLTSNDNVQHFYVLNSVEEFISLTPAPLRLNIQRPVMLDWLDTDRIMLRHAQNQVDYYAEARWASNAGDMLGTVITQSLKNNHVANNIFYQGSEMNSDYLLVVEITRFQADYALLKPKTAAEHQQPPIVKVALQAKLLSMPGNVLHSSFTINQQVPAQRNQLRDIIKAFDVAVEASMQDLVEYVAVDLQHSTAKHTATKETNSKKSDVGLSFEQEVLR